MKQVSVPWAEQDRKVHKIRRRWRHIGRLLMAVAAFYTVYAMILPAATWEGEPVCTLPEHIHTDACYQTVKAHVPGEESDGDGALVSVLEEVSAQGEEGMATEERVLICSLQEHTHTAACFEASIKENPYVCGKQEHTHTADCYFSDGRLRCTQQEHTHSAACVNEAPKQKRTLGASATDTAEETPVYYVQVTTIVPSNTEKYLLVAAGEDYALGLEAQSKGKGTAITLQAVTGADGYYTVEETSDEILWYMRKNGTVRNVSNSGVYLLPGKVLFGNSASQFPSYTWNEDGTCEFYTVVNKVTGYLYEADGVFSYNIKGTAANRKMRVFKQVTELPPEEATQTLTVQAAFVQGEPQPVAVEVYTVGEGNRAMLTAFTGTLTEENGYTVTFSQLPVLPAGARYAVRARTAAMMVSYGEEITVFAEEAAFSVGIAGAETVAVQCFPAVVLPQTGGAGDAVLYGVGALLWLTVMIGWYRCAVRRKQ